MANDRKQDQVLAALDKIAGRLIRMEKERNALSEELKAIKGGSREFEDTLITKVNNTISAYKGEQTTLKNSLAKQANDHADLKRRMGELVDHKTMITSITTDNMRRSLDESLKIQRQMRQELEMNSVRQARLEEELLASQQRQTSMLRKLEAMSTKYQRLTKKIERVEQDAADAMAALENRAFSSIREIEDARKEEKVKAIRYEKTKAGFPKISEMAQDAIEQDNQQEDVLEQTARKQAPVWQQKLKTTMRYGASAAMIAVMIGAIGYGVWRTSYAPGAERYAGQTLPTDVAQKIETSEVFEEAEAIAREDQAMSTPLTVEELSETETAAGNVDEQGSLDKDLTAMDVTLDTSLPKAFKKLEKAAFDGNAEAQHDLAALYSAGENGVKQNFVKSAYWFEQAAQNGISNARYNLGVLYHQGLGVDQDYTQAIYWYNRAAELGHPEAQYNLGIAHIEGVGADYSPKLAVAYFRQAAQGGVSEAAYNLGLILENGLMGEPDVEEAVYWYARAKDMGNKPANAALEQLQRSAKLSRQQVDNIMASYDAAYYEDDIRNIETAVGTETSEAANVLESVDNRQNNQAVSNWQKLVSSIQTQLKILALYHGPEDGIYGPNTRSAIMLYEENIGLPVTGEPSRELLAHMLDQTDPVEQGSSQ